MIPRTLIFCFWLATTIQINLAEAQSFPHLSIDIQGTTLGIKGGEQPNTSMSTGPLVIGKPTTAGFAKATNMCGFSVAARLPPGGVSGWAVSVTPLKVD